jgi:hypothetical protein
MVMLEVMADIRIQTTPAAGEEVPKPLGLLEGQLVLERRMIIKQRLTKLMRLVERVD